MPTVDLSERDSKETSFVKEEVTNDAEVFGEVVVDVEGSQRGETIIVVFIWMHSGRRLGSASGRRYPARGSASLSVSRR